MQTRSSRLPLTMAELTDLINMADSGYEDGKGLVASIWERFSELEFNEDELRGHVIVSSDYYPEFGGWYEDLLEEWIALHRSEAESDMLRSSRR